MCDPEETPLSVGWLGTAFGFYEWSVVRFERAVFGKNSFATLETSSSPFEFGSSVAPLWPRLWAEFWVAEDNLVM
jgi:hypothetical protein